MKFLCFLPWVSYLTRFLFYSFRNSETVRNRDACIRHVNGFSLRRNDEPGQTSSQLRDPQFQHEFFREPWLRHHDIVVRNSGDLEYRLQFRTCRHYSIE